MTIARPPQPSRAKANNAASPANSAATCCQPGTARGDRTDEDGADLTSPAAMDLARFRIVARKMRTASFHCGRRHVGGCVRPVLDDARCEQVDSGPHGILERGDLRVVGVRSGWLVRKD